MKIPFYKYQATGNDFVIIDHFGDRFFEDLSQEQIELLCHRKYGIGADGLMIIESDVDYDFRMIYYNSDGRSSSMCGNGGRAISHLAHHLGYIMGQGSFIAVDGKHEIKVNGGQFELKMNDVSSIHEYNNDFVLNTGSLHYIKLSEEVGQLEVVMEAHKIRYNEDFIAEGINVNFVEVRGDGLFMRTYERGVEDETLSCGTGATAAALVFIDEFGTEVAEANEVKVMTRGGELKVKCTKTEIGYEDIWLCGSATKVYEGIIDLKF